LKSSLALLLRMPVSGSASSMPGFGHYRLDQILADSLTFQI